MDFLYDATIYSFPNGRDREGYGIGLFRTEEEAQEAVCHYLHHVPGFKDYYCEAEITRLSVPGVSEAETVYRYVGWNVDETGNETDVMESCCYTQRWEAQQALDLASAETPRQEWSLDSWRIGSLFWVDGFDREYPGGKMPPTLKQVRTILESAMDPRQLVKVTFHYSDSGRYFFPLAVSRDLFLATEEFDFLLDGCTIRRVRDVEALELRSGIYTRIMTAEGWPDRISVPDVDISSWKAVFSSLQKLDRNIIVENEHADGDSDFIIGAIQAVEADCVLLLPFDADGIWEQEPWEIPYADITSVSFDTRYINVFSKYLPPRP